MSIPKEPRQLMINLMYLVLTAMLAMNVSAEVMNAFKTIDDSLSKSIAVTNNAIDGQQKALNSVLEDESKAKFRPLAAGITDIRAKIKDFNDYVDGLKKLLIDEAGNKNGEVDEGDYENNDMNGMPIGMKDKDVTSRIMVLDPLTNENGKGYELEQKIKDTRDEIISTYEGIVRKNAEVFGLMKNGKVDEGEVQKDIDGFAKNITLEIDPDWKEKALNGSHSKKNADAMTWPIFRFDQMPLISALPLLTKFQADAKNAEALAVGKLAGLAGGKTVVFNSFFPVLNAKKAYVIKGETFEADISIGAYSSDLKPENIRLTVNGTGLKIGSDGIAKYTAHASSTGKQTLNLKATVTNPLTGEVSTGTSTFEYEVGVRSATVSADKMNVFYTGVDNPISVSAAGVSSNDLKVSATGVTATKVSQGHYMVTASNKGNGKAVINVSGGGLPNTPFEFRVKDIPTPIAKLGNKTDGKMGSGEMKAQLGLIPVLENFDFEARCKIQGFTLVYVAARQDAIEATNRGGSFNTKAQNLIKRAKPGDKYYFENVKAKCPGWNIAKKVNPLTFTIR